MVSYNRYNNAKDYILQVSSKPFWAVFSWAIVIPKLRFKRISLSHLSVAFVSTPKQQNSTSYSSVLLCHSH